MGIREVCIGLDKLVKEEEELNLITIAKAAGTSKGAASGVLAVLVKAGALEIENPTHRPYAYKATIEGFSEELERGTFKGLFWAKRKDELRDSPIEKLFEPKPEEWEIDPFEILEQLSEDDFARLISMFLFKKSQESKPLKEQIEYQRVRVSFLENQEGNLNEKIQDLNNQLREVRTSLMNTQNELARERGDRVISEQKPRVIMVKDRDKEGGKASSNHQGHDMHSVKVHRKPIMTHAPASVLHRKR